MLTPKKNSYVPQSVQLNFTTPIKKSHKHSLWDSAETADVSPNSENIRSFEMLGLKSPWQVSSQKQLPISSKEEITDRYIPARKLFSEQCLSMHSISMQEMQVENQETQNVIPFEQISEETQNTKDYNHYLSSLYGQSEKNGETVQTFSNKNFLRYSNHFETSSNQEMFQNLTDNYFPLKKDKKIEKKRKIEKVPFRILDAPNLQDDYYFNLLEWSEYCNNIAVGLGDKVYLWDAGKQTVQKIAEANKQDYSNSTVCSVSWAKNAPLLAIGSSNGFIDIYDIERNQKVRTLGSHSQRVSSISWNNQHLLSSGSRDKDICHSDIRESNIYFFRKSYGHKQEVCGLKWSPDSQKLCSGGNDNKLLIWDINNLTSPVIKYTDHIAAVKALAWSPHQHGLLISGGGTADKTIRFRNVLTGSTNKILETGSQVCNLIFSKTENQFVSTHGYSMNEIAVWKYSRIQKLVSLKNHHSSRVLYLTISPDGETVVTGAGDETLRFWKFFPKKTKIQMEEQKDQKDLLEIRHISIR